MRQLSAGVYHKLNVINPREKLSAGQYLQMISNDQLECNLSTIFQRLRNTSQYWVRPRNDLRCMVQHYGPATWFLTFSPSEWQWEDLGEYLREVNHLEPGIRTKPISELVAMDPVSTSRFLDNKFRAMLQFILSDDAVLGKVTHYFWRREYQGRGMQHFHLLIWIDGSPILGASTMEEVAEFILKYVTCNIPHKSLCPTLYNRVIQYQKHNDNSYCLREKKTKCGYRTVCRFGFPRPVAKSIEIRDVVVAIAGRKSLKLNSRLYDLPRNIDERYINDYNAAVLLAWNGNMDIQFVGETTAMLNWYITKYTTKSEISHSDDLFMDINSTKSLRSRLYNVGLRALTHRESGALEASDTLLGIPLYGTDSDTSIRWVDVNESRKKCLKPYNKVKEMNPDSTNIFFASWVDDRYPKRPDALENMHLYDFVRWFDIVNEKPKSVGVEVYQLSEKSFLKKRSRAYLINHYKYNVQQNPEKYFHSVLLMFKPWRELKDLKSGYDTYVEAFHASKDKLLEAVQYEKKMKDIQTAVHYAKHLIEEKVKEFEKEFHEENDEPDKPLAFTPLQVNCAMQEFRVVAEQQVIDVEKFVSALNTDQKRVFDHVVKVLQENSATGSILRHFVSGTGGTGKSYLIKTIKAWVKKNLGKDVAISAPTGLSAYNISGLTVYRLLQLPVEHGHTPKYRELTDNALEVMRSEFKNVHLIIIDEISMVSNVTFMYIHLRLSEIFSTTDVRDGWFGKKHILLFGDLLQLPPVHEESPFIKLSTKNSKKCLGSLCVINLWQELFSYDELTINMRQVNNNSFVDMLNRIRIGVVNPEDRRMLESRKIKLVSQTTTGRLKEICDYISGLPLHTVCLLSNRHQCSVLNEEMLTKIQSDEIKLVAKDSLECTQHLKNKVMKLLTKREEDNSRTAGLDKVIIIKVGAKVMLQRNIDVTNGLVNGAIGQILSVKRNIDDKNIIDTVKISFLNGEVHDLQRVESKFEVMDNAYVIRKQYPITLAYGITIHKSQGLSLKHAVIDVGTSVFTCGQTYVALSRVTNLEGIHLINFNPSDVKAQASAIEEYNRLRRLYRPDLSILKSDISYKIKAPDTTWTTNPTAADIQIADSNVTKKVRNKSKEHLREIKGFQNLDSVSCYANAALQSLFHIDSVRNRFTVGEAGDLMRHNFLMCEEAEVSDAMPFRQMAGDIYLNIQQQDCVEFINSFINTCEVLQDITEYKLKNTIHCNSCNYTSTTLETGFVFNIYIPTDAKERYTTVEKLFHNTQSMLENLTHHECCNCQQTGFTFRKSTMQSANEVIILQFLLFCGQEKITDLKLRNVPNVKLSIDGSSYTPSSAIFHHGHCVSSGHYTSFLKTCTNWKCADDTRVQQKRWPTNAKDIYILILKKCFH